MSSTYFFACFTAATPRSIIFSRVELNLCWICESEVPMPVWIRARLAGFKASAATSISFLTALVSPHTMALRTVLATSLTASKSPGEEMGKPASMISTPSSSRRFARISFSALLSLQPGTCSPSRKVVSKI